MTPTAAKASYRRQIAMHGETLTLQRNGTPPITQAVRARVTGYQPDELIGQIQQGDVRIIVLAEDIGSFPVPIRERSTDSVVINGRFLTVQAVDERTRKVGGVLIAYEIRARG